jgi:hypothetical protein
VSRVRLSHGSPNFGGSSRSPSLCQVLMTAGAYAALWAVGLVEPEILAPSPAHLVRAKRVRIGVGRPVTESRAASCSDSRCAY